MREHEKEEDEDEEEGEREEEDKGKPQKEGGGGEGLEGTNKIHNTLCEMWRCDWQSRMSMGTGKWHGN